MSLLPYGRLGRTLPTHICRHPDGLLVRVSRGGVRFQALVPNGFNGDALAEALRHRDRFLKLAGPVVLNGLPSNTGITGISESTTWRHNRPYPCFIVQWSRAGKRTVRRVTFGPHNGLSRSAAINQAKTLRRRMAGPLQCNPIFTEVAA